MELSVSSEFFDSVCILLLKAHCIMVSHLQSQINRADAFVCLNYNCHSILRDLHDKMLLGAKVLRDLGEAAKVTFIGSTHTHDRDSLLGNKTVCPTSQELA